MLAVILVLVSVVSLLLLLKMYCIEQTQKITKEDKDFKYFSNIGDDKND